MSRLQENAPDWAADLIRRCGLRYTVPGATPEEVRECLRTLKAFVDGAKFFYSVVNTTPITEEFIDVAVAALYAETAA